MPKFENLTSIIAEKRFSRAKAKGKRLRKGIQPVDGRVSSESSSNSKSELEEQVRQRKKKTKIKINSSRVKAEERIECQKGSGDGKSEHEYDDRVSFMLIMTAN